MFYLIGPWANGSVKFSTQKEKKFLNFVPGPGSYDPKNETFNSPQIS